MGELKKVGIIPKIERVLFFGYFPSGSLKRIFVESEIE